MNTSIRDSARLALFASIVETFIPQKLFPFLVLLVARFFPIHLPAFHQDPLGGENRNAQGRAGSKEPACNLSFKSMRRGGANFTAETRSKDRFLVFCAEKRMLL